MTARRLELLNQLYPLVKDAPAYWTALYEEGTIEELERAIAEHQPTAVSAASITRHLTLSELIAQVPPDHAWLLRSDENHGFFAHVCEQSFVRSCGLRGASSKAFGDTPEEALSLAIQGIL